MQKKGAYILLLLFILHNTPLTELLKLPTLVAHYLEHKERNGSISVGEFLCMHYWGQDENDNDQDRDMQLPYKNVELHTVHHSFIPLAKVVAVKQQVHRVISINYPVLKDNYLPEPALSALFRPPKV